MVERARRLRIEWPTVALAAATYTLWLVALWPLAAWPWLAVPLAAWAIAQHGSLTHEVVHGHPFRSPLANAALVAPPLALVVPFLRFRDSHLAHHHDSRLTDPFDDPELNYLDGSTWEALPRPVQAVLAANNTLAGRLLLGPLIGQIAWMAADLRAMRAGDARVLRGWLWHLPPLAGLLAILWVSPLGLPLYLLACYLGLSLLKIRTFLEHQAAEKVRARTAIIEDRGPLALLFLNNNLHVVHHMHPRVPWYRLPALYHANPDRYLGVNEGYRYTSYADVFRRYLFARKDPVAHPLWRR